MRKIWGWILDAVFPPKCVICGDRDGEEWLCDECLEKVEAGGTWHKFGEWGDLEGVMVCCETSPELRRAIHALKYWLRKPVAERLAGKMVEGAEVLRRVQKEETVMMAVPLHWSRLLWRGFNQAEQLGRRVAGGLDLKWERRGMKRVKMTKSQMGLLREDRLMNLKEAFGVRGDVVGKVVILVDDVVTTGTTLGECARVLKRAGAKKVVGLVLCRGV